ncbi:bis-aminopropyl spermidine synthase family protein [Paenibacillus apiarius]|uniref:bis-aminopropyl spermidine synthase family protein n=1 Tax=Paenibacillus apiarius TaxID=46240 RepID=UPI00198090A3|nr:bis-aminopropyl spermidine synthase family protein [Paenibacillus apiarius]MBN3526108.1 bis-aminopropyl spermidine synthase family protein [Paenibacillus apiarius]
MNNEVMNSIYSQVSIKDGKKVIENILLDIYFKPGISTKDIARKTLLPLPIVAAIKKEFVKAGIIEQNRGVNCTTKGLRLVEHTMGYGHLDRSLYQRLKYDQWQRDELHEMLTKLEGVFEGRPQVDVTIDQSRCTLETSLKRAVLALRHEALIGRDIVCLGDDDLVSVSLAFLLKQLFRQDAHKSNTRIHVFEIDKRIISYVNYLAEVEDLPIVCYEMDFREQLPSDFLRRFDCVFTDPPYTQQGMSLFVSRGIQLLKREIGLPIFLSFAHKSPDFALEMQREFSRMGLLVTSVLPRFNEYIGAEIIGNTSQMIVLQSTEETKESIARDYRDALYTGEVRRTIRAYECKRCNLVTEVGFQMTWQTIEQLKKEGCPSCRHDTFELIQKKNA